MRFFLEGGNALICHEMLQYVKKIILFNLIFSIWHLFMRFTLLKYSEVQQLFLNKNELCNAKLGLMQLWHITVF